MSCKGRWENRTGEISSKIIKGPKRIWRWRWWDLEGPKIPIRAFKPRQRRRRRSKKALRRRCLRESPHNSDYLNFGFSNIAFFRRLLPTLPKNRTPRSAFCPANWQQHAPWEKQFGMTDGRKSPSNVLRITNENRTGSLQPVREPEHLISCAGFHFWYTAPYGLQSASIVVSQK